MKINKVIKERRSVREYKGKKVDKHLIEDIIAAVENKKGLQENIGVSFKFIENGGEAYEKLDGIVGYFGKVIKAPHYIYIASDAKEGYLENAGYIGESLVLKATDLGLGTCWMEINEKESDVKKILGIEDDREAIGLLAIGYAKRENKVAGLFDTKGKSISPLTEFGYPNIEVKYADEPVSSRISIKDIAYLKEWGRKASAKELEDRGMADLFYYMRLAPSWGNRQPWKFIIDGEKIILAVEKDDKVNEKVARIEAGIAMLYFELMSHEQGIPGRWQLKKLEEKYNVPKEFFVTGFYKV